VSDNELVATQIEGKHSNLILLNVYRPTNNDVEYNEKLCSEIETIVNDHPKDCIWIAGDLNLPDIDWSSNSVMSHQYTKEISERFILALENSGLQQMIDFPTRICKTLDLFVTNRPSLVTSCKALPGVSDHEIVLVESDMSAKYQRPVKRKVYLWKKADIAGLKSDFSKFNREFCENCKHHMNSSDIDQLWKNFCLKTQEILDRYVPSKMTTSRFSQPWINREIKRLSAKKKRYFKKAKISNNNDDWFNFKHLKQQCQQECRKAHNSYISSMLDEDSKSNPKKFYSFIKSKKCDSSGVAPLKSNGTLFSDSKLKADILNKQFTSVFTSEDTTNVPPPVTPKVNVPHITINRNGLLKLLKDINVHKATGPDNISGMLLKTVCEEVVDSLAIIFQSSLDSGKLPSAWKEAYITPLYKKGDKSMASNYRPVSLTSICCKLLEHVVHSNVISHLDRHGLLSDKQHGFRKERSCESQLITTIQDLADSLNAGGQVDAILLDFSKAFDKVPHQRLLTKVQNCGVTGSLLCWISDFLSDRTQSVVLEGQHSSPTPVTSGVPQGTVLGPLLFLIYINDMPSCVSSTPRLFADDCLLYRTIHSKSDSEILQQDLDNLQEWENNWLMEFNADKCEVIRITKKRKPILSSYTIHGTVLSEVNTAKYLGVNISSDLSWNKHIDITCKKANNTLGFLRRNTYNCSQNVKETCYKSLVRPITEYASTVWDPYTQTNISKLEQVQRRSARYVTGDFRRTSSVTAMLNNLSWETLQQRREHAKVTIMYRIIYHLIAIPIEPYLIKSNSSQVRGHNMRYLVPHSRILLHKASYFPSTIRLWNALPSNVVAATTIEGFKSRLHATTL
jgi:hypothetical protein